MDRKIFFIDLLERCSGLNTRLTSALNPNYIQNIAHMKLIFALVLAVPMFSGPSQTFGDITQAIHSGDASELGRFFDSTVEIAVPDEEDIFNRSEAVKRIHSFFRNYKPESFYQVHQGASRGNDSHYCIGNLSTEKGTFRVYIYTRITGTKQVIKELRFDRD